MAATTESKNYVQKMFIAFLGRAAAPAGLEHYGEMIDNDPAAGKAILFDDLWNSTQARELYDGVSTLEIIRIIYNNVMNRDPADDGLIFYYNQIANEEINFAELAAVIADNAAGAEGTDFAEYTAKVTAADETTAALTTDDLIAGYTTNFTLARASLGDVTAANVDSFDGAAEVAAVSAGLASNNAFTTGTDAFVGTNDSPDVATGLVGTGATFAAADSFTDSTAGDSDVLTLTGDDDFNFGTVSGIEAINVSIAKQLGGGFSVDAANLTGGVVDFTVSDSVTISDVEVTGETVLGITNLSSDLTTHNVTNLDADLDGEAATITVDGDATTVTVSSINDNDTTIVLGNDTATALNISGTAGDNDAVSISGTGTVTLDTSEAGNNQSVEELTLSGGSNDVNFDLTIDDGSNTTYTTSGDYAVTLTGAAADFDEATFVMGATTALDVDTAGDLDLIGQGVFAGGIDVSVDMTTAAIDVQSGNTISITADQTAADVLTLNAANDTAADTLSLSLSNDTSELITANFESIVITTGTGAVVIDEIDMDDNDGAVNLSGGGAITVTTTTAVGSIDVDGGNNVTLTGAVTSAGTTEVEGDGVTTIGAGITSTNDITLIGDSIAVTGTVAAANGDVTVTATNDVSIGVTTATLGSVDIDGKAITGVGAITAQNDIEITGTGAIALGANAVNTTGAGGANTISISGTNMPDVGAIGSANTRDVTIAMSNDSETSDLDGAVTASNSIILSDGKFDATGVTLTAESVMITGDTDFLAGSIIAEALTITSTNDVTITALGEKTAGEGAVVSGGSATGDIDVTVSGASTGTMTVVTGTGDDTVTMDEGAVINVTTGEGNDSITITDSTAGSVINTGGGDDTVDDNETVANTIVLGGGNDTYTPLATSTSSVDFGDGTADTLMAGGLTIGQTNLTNFEILNVAGGTTISYLLLANDATFEVTGGATLTVDGTGAGANTTVTLAGLTGDIGSLPNTAINGSANADIIIGSEMVDVIDAGAGNDTITLGGSGDTAVYDTGADGIDTFKDFTSGSDKYNTNFATTKNTVGGATVGGTLASAAGAVTLDATKDVVEITGTLQSTIVDFNNDTQVLSAISGTSVSITADTNKILVVLYQGGNAYLYEIIESNDGDTLVEDGDVTLVGIFEGIADGGLAPGDII
jgi:hypothetical protein